MFRRGGWFLRLHGSRNVGGLMALLILAPAVDLAPPAGASNNVDPGPGSIGTINRLRVNTAAGAASFTGIVAGTDGQLLWILNTGANDLTLVDNSGGSAAGNRFRGVGVDIIIPSGGSALIYYDSTVAAWIAAV